MTGGGVRPEDADDGRSQWERMVAGDLYVASDPQIVAAQAEAARRQHAFNATHPDDVDGRRRLLEELLGSVGRDVEVRPPLHVDYGSHVTIGDGSFVNFGLVALDVAPITIGRRVLVVTNVQLLTPTHPIGAGLRRAGWEAAEPITIGDDVWLGGGAIVCPGVTVGHRSVVGAGAVVTRDVPDGVVVVGNPARVLRRVPD